MKATIDLQNSWEYAQIPTRKGRGGETQTLLRNPRDTFGATRATQLD